MKRIFLIVITMVYTVCLQAVPVINSVNLNSSSIGQYEKLEFTVYVTASYTNAFDPDPATSGLDMWAILTSPSGVTKRANAFFMDADNDGTAETWKIRFASGETGAWSYFVNATDSTGTGAGYSGGFSIFANSNKGFIRKSGINNHYFAYENGGSFWGIGHNQGWQGSAMIESPDFPAMQASGENVISFWISTPWATPFSDASRVPFENATNGIKNYNQRAAKFLDDKFSRAEQYGIKIILSVWIHDMLRDSSVSCWSGSDWNKHAYSSVTRAANFYDNNTLRTLQRNYYRYIVARYGYSRALFMWDLIVEANGTDRWCGGDQNAVESWLGWASSVIDWYDIYKHPRTASRSGGWDSWNTDGKWATGYALTGVSQIHSYEWKNDMAKVPRVIAADSQYMWGLGRPGYIGEFGSDNSANQPVDLHRASWAALASGSASGPMLWCDDGSFINMNASMLVQQQYLAEFVSGIDFENTMTAAKTVSGLNANNYGWATGSSDFVIAWIFNDSGNVSQSNISINGFSAGNFSALWYDAWTGSTVNTLTVASSAGSIALTVPLLAKADIALKISKIVNTPTPTFTVTPGGPTLTYTYTPTYTFTHTPTPVFTKTPSQDYSNVYIYPSLAMASKRHKGIWFRNLTAMTTLYIYDMKGSLVYKVSKNTPDGSLYWNFMKDLGKGNYPATGVYVYVLADEKGRVSRGKFAILM